MNTLPELRTQLAAAEADTKAAFGRGYEVYSACVAVEAGLRRAIRAVEEAEATAAKAATPNVMRYVTGNTFRNRDALKRLGLRWNPGIQAWTGMSHDLMNVTLPAGCHFTSHADAALASMDHADSDY